MKTKILTLAFLLAAPAVFAQNSVATNIASDTAGSVAMLIKYIGTGSAATVEIDAATGDIELEVNNVADNTNVDQSSVCAGGTANSLDVDDAQCNTFGEVVDLINASTHWRAVLVGALRSDTLVNTLQTMAEVQATRTDGLALYLDSAVADWAGNPLVPQGCLTDIRCYMTPQGKILENPFAGKMIDLRWLAGYSTYDTASNFYIYSVKNSYRGNGTLAETVTTLWQEATGASTANKQLTQFQYFGLLGRPHERLVVRIVSTTNTSTFFLQAYGREMSVN